MGPVELLVDAFDDGHTYPQNLRERYKDRRCHFTVDDLNAMYSEGLLTKVEHKPALPKAVRAEARIAAWVARRAASIEGGYEGATEPPIAGLNQRQAAALTGLLKTSTAILTGGPGTGKTYVMSVLLKYLKKVGVSYVVSAPTGKAASVLGVRLGENVATVHNMLGIIPGEVSPNKICEADLVVVDEATMLDSEVFAALTDYVGDRKLILMGDPDQLPSVSAGQPFHDLYLYGVNTGKISIFELTQNMRTSVEGIVNLISLIKQRKLPESVGEGVVNWKTKPSRAVELILDLSMLSRKMGTEVHRKDVLYLSGLRQSKFDLGTENINHMVSHKLYPERIQGQKFAIGDRVMFTVNDRYYGFVNGELGTILEWGDKGRSVKVANDEGKHYRLTVSDCKEKMEWAYALTIHKAQGSEADIVILPLDEQTIRFADIRMIYTAMSRAKKMLILVGNMDSLFPALRRKTERDTMLGIVDMNILATYYKEDPLNGFFHNNPDYE